jgi:hypothetical protein
MNGELTLNLEPRTSNFEQGKDRLPAVQTVSVECGCGRNGKARLAHYDIASCSCGLRWWALQPKRNGPLVAYPFPNRIRLQEDRE